MPCAIVHYCPGGTKDQYDKAIAAVHPSRDGLLAGQPDIPCRRPLGGRLDDHGRA
jgi:hypothetical protein